MRIKDIQVSIEKQGGFMKLHKYNPERAGQNWLVQRKYDGVFVAAKQYHGRWEFFSRTGKPLYIEDAVHDSLCANLPKYATDLMFIGELICARLSLEQLSGLVNPNRRTAWVVDDEQVLYSAASIVWHDSLRLVDGRDNTPYIERYNRMSLHIPYVIENIRIASDNLDVVFQGVTQEQGWEGLVLKDPSAPYIMGKRSHGQLKYVRQYTEDLECIGVQMGQGKRTGVIGSLVFRSLDGTTAFNADLGAGWDDAKRQELTDQWMHGELEHVLGLWEVQGLQPSSTGRAIRLPKAIRRRYDKD